MKELEKLSIKYPRMTVRTLVTLMTIRDNEGCAVFELSKIMNVAAKNIATTIRRLEEGGEGEGEVLKFKPNPNYNKSRLIYLTPKGKRLLKGI